MDKIAHVNSQPVERQYGTFSLCTMNTCGNIQLPIFYVKTKHIYSTKMIKKATIRHKIDHSRKKLNSVVVGTAQK